MAEIKKISTELQLLDKFLDTSGDAGTSGQVLTSTGTGINWVSASSGTITGSGTTGYIPKWTGSSALGDSILEVNSALPSSVIIPEYLRHRGDTNTYFGFQSNDTFIVATNNTERLRVDSTGYVGIGTTSPDNTLDVVASDVNITPNAESSAVFRRNGNNYLTILSNASNEGGILFGNAVDDNNGSISYKHNTQSMQFATADVERIRITNIGNVGIGTTSPLHKLHVNGASDGNSIYTAMLQNAGTAPNTASKLLFVQGGSTIRGAVIGGLQEATAGSPTSMVFETSAAYATPTERMRITSTGNVGIGTTSPGGNLHVVGRAGQAGEIYLSDIDNGSGTSDALLISKSGTNAFVYNRDSGSLSFGSNNTSNYLNITSAGNVGIGTTSPSAGAKLEVIGKGDQLGSTGFYVNSSFKDDTNVGVFICHDDTVNTTGAIAGINQLSFITYGSSWGERMKITGAGNVGIGTTSPGAKLDITGSYGDVIKAVSGSQSITTNFVAPTTGSGRNNIISTAGEFNIGTSDAQPFSLGTSSISRVSILSGGNVGINTTSPSYKLEVNGTLGVKRADGIIFAGSGGPGMGNKITADTSNDFIFSTSLPSAPYTVSERMRITNAGNVGIGTSSPGTFLQLGTYAVAGKYINQATYPDIPSEHMMHITAPSTNAYYGGGISFGETAFTAANIVVRDAGGSGALDLCFGTGTASGVTEKMRITNAGNVGINCTPSYKLQWSDGTRTGLLDTNIGAVVIGSVSNDALAFYTNLTEKMRITSSGNVGIGNASPNYPLVVNGVSASNRFYVPNATATTAWVLQARNSNNTADSGLYFENGDAQLLLRDDSNNLNVRINADTSSYINGGNLGLGTTSPAQKLTVNSGRMLVTNSTTPFYIKVNSGYKSWVHHISSDDKYIFAPSTTDGGETWDWANQTSFSTSGVVTAKNFALSSDKRNKTKIEDLTGDNVDISWKSFEMKGDQGEYRVGVIAQELEENHPEFVNTDDRGFKSVKYIDLLIAKIAELEARLEKLEK